ncbi:peptidoglycan DD-metalloendopeptidase family protein [Streptomyces sp. NPDC057950]|uniref:aggregation-promoting factor C-terminal-like domain-containing protein n=1 Tax=Streptomyces sp. NPDC057950 TaxID=3346288 RepID=UPI0036EEB987
MPADLDIVGGAAVDVVPIAPEFHTKLKAIVLPVADRVGEDAGRRMGDAISRHITVSIPDAITAGGRTARASATREGGQIGGSLAQSIKRKLELAFRSLPRADVRLGDAGFNADLDRLRSRIQTLSGKTVGIDLDAGAALTEIQAIDAELVRLGANHADVNVRADTTRARAALAAIRAEVDEVDRQSATVKVRADTSQAEGALARLVVSMGIVAALPVVPIAAAGIGAIASAAVAAGAGLGALALVGIPALKGVTSAIQAKTAAENDSTRATGNGVAAGVKAAQSALQMASAQSALTSAHRQAAQQIEQANRAVSDSERSLSDAKRSARQAELDLTQARRDATQQLADLQDKLIDGALSEKDATLRVQEAQQELNKVKADASVGKATDLQVQRAQLAYDQAVQNAKEQKKSVADLTKQEADARKAGIDGNDSVKQAAERLAEANRKVADQTRAVADAQRKARDAQVQAAEQIAAAERGVESARLSNIDTTAKAVTKANEYRKALAKLTPDQRKLYDSIAGPTGLTKAFKDWSTSLQPAVLPLFVRGVNGAKNSLPGLSPLVRTAADAVGDLMDAASKELKSPFWQGFKRDINSSAKPAIVGLGKSFGNILTGMAGIVDAFLPHMDGISRTMQRITGRFANWGKNLKGSPAFERFLKYVKDTAPQVGEVVGKAADALLSFSQAIAPTSAVVFAVIGPLLDGVKWLSENMPGFVQTMWGLYVVSKAVAIATKAWAIAQGLFDAAMAIAALETWSFAAALSAIGWTELVALITAIVVAIAALVAGIIWAFKNVGWFRGTVEAAWTGIKVATLFLWNSVLKPAFNGMWIGIKAIGTASVWLWKNAIEPAFKGIWLVARILFAVLVTAVITPIVFAIKILGAVAMWLWRDGLKPSFEGIALIATWLWTTILKPTFKLVWDALKWLGDKFVWLYQHAVLPAVGWISDKAAWLWNKALAPVLRFIWDGLKWVGDKFKWLYDHGVKPPAEWIADKTSWLYEHGLKPAFDKMKSALGVVADAFDTAKTLIGKAWNKVSDIAKKPVNFIIEWVYTKGIKAVWDQVADFVDLPHLPKAPKLLEAGGTVGNGWGPAVPMKANKPTAIVGEGNPNYPEFVIPTDPKYRSRAVALHQAAGTQLLESGGVLGGAWDWTKDTVGDVIGKGIDWAKTGADLLVHPSKVWTALTKPIMNRIGDGVGVAGKFGAAVGKYPVKMVDGLKSKIVEAAESLLFASEGTGGQWIKPVNAAFGTRFGVPGKMWSSGHHTGLDFPVPTGTRVNAVDDGKVTFAAGGGPYGNHVEISHGGGLSSLYAHMSRILTSVGAVVKQGQEIGKSGATGNTTGPHVHLEARRNGTAVDPMPYLTGGGGFAAGATGAAQQYAKSILGNYGWGPGQFGPLKQLWQGESGWRYNAKNSSSGAYGIPQALPASKMGTEGPDWLTNPRTQIRWGMDYIKHRSDYGTPAAAYSKWLSRSPHWYDDGGLIPPGLSLVANGTGKPEPVFTGSQWQDIRASKGGGGPTTVHADVRVFVGDREITDIVRVEVDAREAENANALDNGRWV